MAKNYEQIKIDDAAGHPETGAFNVDIEIATDEWNALNIDAEGGVTEMLSYLLKNRSRANTGTDTVSTTLMGRLITVSESSEGSNPFGAAATTITMEHIHAALMFVTLVTNPQLETIDYTDTEVDFAYTILGSGPAGAKVWKPADITNLKGLSENKQSYSNFRGYGLMKVGDLQFARDLP